MIRNQWYAIATSEMVGREPTFMKRLGQDLLLMRGKSGLSAFVDRCTHRGAQLSKGKIKNGCIECPFHGIQFQSDGSCTLVPANGQASTEDLSRFHLKTLPIKEQDGIVYLWWGDKEPGPIPFFKQLTDAKYQTSVITDHWDTHYSRVIENQLDVAHLPFVHHNTIGRGNRTLANGPKVVWEDENTLITSANNEVDHGQHPKKPEECRIKSTYLSFKFPNIWLNHISEKMKILALFVPVDEEHTLLILRFYNRVTGVAFLDRWIAWGSRWANLVVERQDRRVVITQRPKRTDYKMKENLIRADRPILEYRKRRATLLEEDLS